MRYFILTLLLISLFTACQKSQAPQQTASPDAKRYTLKGKIVAVDKTNKKATIAHDEIPGYMSAMTMEFPIKDEWVFEALAKDAEIRAELVVDNAQGKFWLENVAVIGAAPTEDNPALPPLKETVVQIGKEVPDFKLTNQDGNRIGIRDFHRRALAITFIYARCPLPNYCIAMSERFSDAAKQLAENPELKDKIRLLSISFDPENDTPKKLKEYGTGYLGRNAKPDFSVWQLATGRDKEIKEVAGFFGLRYETDSANKTLINHSLLTIVIAPDGTVRKVFSGNEWTTGDLLRELQATVE